MNFFLPLTCSLYLWLFFREIREYKSRVESYSREMLRKEAQCRDLQQRLENGEGSKCINVINANSLMRIEIALIRKKKWLPFHHSTTIKLKIIGLVGYYNQKSVTALYSRLQKKKISFFLFFSSSTTLYSCFRSTLFLDFDGLLIKGGPLYVFK